MDKDLERTEDEEIDDILKEDDALEPQEKEVKEKAEPPEKDEPKPKDVRSAIKNAMKEVGDKDEDKSGKVQTSSKQKDGDRGLSSKNVKKEDESDDSSDSDENKELTKKPEEKLEVPPYYKNKGKAAWDKLSNAERSLIIAREKEVSDGFAKNSEKVRAFDELEQVLAPRRQAIQQFGVSPAQTIDRLFQWMEALSHQDLNYRLNAFNALAQSFGVPVNKLVPKRAAEDQQTSESDASPDNNQPPEWFQSFAQNVNNEFGSIKAQAENQSKNAANAFLNDWAKDKTHFEKVRQTMYQLIASGVVQPKANGDIDLDTAYNKAILLDPETSALVAQEKATKEAAEAKAKRDKEAREKAARLLKAKNAGVSLKPAAPALNADELPKNRKPNGSGKSVSVRDSIAQSLAELRDAE